MFQEIKENFETMSKSQETIKNKLIEKNNQIRLPEIASVIILIWKINGHIKSRSDLPEEWVDLKYKGIIKRTTIEEINGKYKRELKDTEYSK